MKQGMLKKMTSRYQTELPVDYYLPIGDQSIHLNPLIGKPLKIEYSGKIFCMNCGRKTSKSFSQGYCFPCFRSLARCDSCIIKPELCHFDAGTCREPEWGVGHCMISHTVYLANSSGLKVGVTRTHQKLTRWIDQGAVAAIPILEVKRRKDAGLIEIELKKSLNDKTNWRAMLKGEIQGVDLQEERRKVFDLLPDNVEFKRQAEDVTVIDYPVSNYPKKIASLNLEKTPILEGTLQGIKGQYLIFDSGVINMRKYAGYEVSFSH